MLGISKIIQWFSPKPIVKPKRYITIAIDENSAPTFTITKDISPEVLAKLIIRISTVADGEQFVKILEENGYIDVRWRMRAASIVCIDAVLSEMTEPQSNQGVIVQAEEQPQPTEASAPVPVVEAEDDKPLIEALGH